MLRRVAPTSSREGAVTCNKTTNIAASGFCSAPKKTKKGREQQAPMEESYNGANPRADKKKAGMAASCQNWSKASSKQEPAKQNQERGPHTQTRTLTLTFSRNTNSCSSMGCRPNRGTRLEGSTTTSNKATQDSGVCDLLGSKNQEVKWEVLGQNPKFQKKTTTAEWIDK